MKTSHFLSLLIVLVLVHFSAVTPAQLITDPNHAGNWQGATLGTFAQLLYGADTPANRQLLVTNQVLDQGIFDPTGFAAATLIPTPWAMSYNGCFGQSFDTTGTGSFNYTCASGLDIFQSANGIDEFWFQSSGTIGDTVFDLGGPVLKAVVFNTIDHGPLPQEAIESTVYLSNDQMNWTQAVVERIWLNGFHGQPGVLWDGFVFSVKTGTNSTFRYASVIHGGPGALISDGDDEINGIMGFQDFQPPFIDLHVQPGSISVAPAPPLANQAVTVSAVVGNSGNTSSQAEASLYLGDPNLGGTLIQQQTLTLGYGSSTSVNFNWVPTNSGLASLFVVMNNLTPNLIDANPSNDRSSRVIAINPPVFDVAMSSSEIVGWPGASFQGQVVIANRGTAPASIDTFNIASSWATIVNSPVGLILPPGASTTALVQVTIPPGTFGGPVGGAAIPYGLGVDLVSGTHPVSATMIVKVFSQPLTPTTVRVVDDVTSAPLPGALISIEGIAATLAADSLGEVTLPLPDGPRGFFGYQSGYIAGAVSADIGPGPTIVEIRLGPGQTIQIQQIVQQQLTTAQILARGINVMDPVNNVIVDFVVYLQIGGFPLVLPGVEIPVAPPVGTSFSFGGPCVCAGGGGSFTIGATFTQHPNGQSQTWIVIPGSVMALKQFFEATVFVVNNAVAPNPTDVQIQNAMVSLNLPAGLGLPDLNGMPQSLTQSLGTLDAGGSAQASWVVRGDIPGTYQLTGNASGDLYAFSNFVTSLSASASSEPFDVVLPQLRLEFQYPTSVTAGVPFNFGVLVTNESVAPAQHVRVSLKVENLVHCALCPTQPMMTTVYFDPFANTIRAEVLLGDIDPSQSALAQFCLVPDVSGVVTGVVIETWSSSAPAPQVVIAPSYPGSGDAQLSTGVGILDGDSIHVVAPGQTAVALVESPGGTYATSLFWYVVGFYDLGASPSEGLPGLWIFGQQFFIAFPMAPPFSTGRPVSFIVPPSLAGLKLLSQAVFIDPATTLGYASSDAHEFIVIP